MRRADQAIDSGRAAGTPAPRWPGGELMSLLERRLMLGFGGWLISASPGSPPNLLPIAGMRAHAEDPACWCRPTVDDLGVVVHNPEPPRAS